MAAEPIATTYTTVIINEKEYKFEGSKGIAMFPVAENVPLRVVMRVKNGAPIRRAVLIFTDDPCLETYYNLQAIN